MMMAEMKPTKLMCEHLTDPLGIDVSSPRLSWVLEATGRGKKQSAYQILVSYTEQELREDNGTLWDSGKVFSDETVGVVYTGGSCGREPVASGRSASSPTCPKTIPGTR